jgi:hypothetical protein
MTDSGGDKDRHPRLKVDDLIIQLQLAVSFKNIIGLGGPPVIMPFSIQDVDHMETEIRRILNGDETHAFTATAVNYLWSLFQFSNENLSHLSLPFIRV